MTPLPDLAPGTPVAVVPVDGGAPRVAVATPDGASLLPREALAGAGHLRLVWWSAASALRGTGLLAGVRPRAVWDLAAVARLLSAPGRDDTGAVWATAHDLPLPALPHREPTLLELGDDGPEGGPVGSDGQLTADWRRAPASAERAPTWARLALQVQQRQEAALDALPDPRRTPVGAPLPRVTAWAESAAALLAVELEGAGLPLDLPAAGALVAAAAGPRPSDPGDEARQRAARDAVVHRAFGREVDLRNPAAVRALLAAVGLDLPDTRSWRLEPHRATSPAVAALLDWRRAERIATTYGWGWLDRCVGPDGRLRGTWTAAEGAGRMTASNGLHSLPAAFRAAVAAEPGRLLVRADLGQVEPRVLAAVSGDPALAAAAREDDLYAPVARALGCDRPTAKIAVLAAMYGQTTGTAGRAFERMRAAYPTAVGLLHAAEERGRTGGSLRTWGGRLLPLGSGGHGRFARNAVVQGAAAELFKVWAVTVRAGLGALDGEIVLCLHDELLLHVPRERADEAVALVHRALDDSAGRWAAGSGVRFVAEVGVGARWSEAKAP